MIKREQRRIDLSSEGRIAREKKHINPAGQPANKKFYARATDKGVEYGWEK